MYVCMYTLSIFFNSVLGTLLMMPASHAVLVYTRTITIAAQRGVRLYSSLKMVLEVMQSSMSFKTASHP